MDACRVFWSRMRFKLCFVLFYISIRLRLISIYYNKLIVFDATHAGVQNVINHQNEKKMIDFLLMDFKLNATFILLTYT